ncbi:MAG: hypothetical protein IPK75_12630 [Acidobacteria bacterium]|nr:hypothetical protein [Acidobacteriota bacterium]
MQQRPATEAEYLRQFGYAPGSAVGKLGWEFFSAPNDAARIKLGAMIGWTVPANEAERQALEAFDRSVERLRVKHGVAA